MTKYEHRNIVIELKSKSTIADMIEEYLYIIVLVTYVTLKGQAT